MSFSAITFVVYDATTKSKTRTSRWMLAENYIQLSELVKQGCSRLRVPANLSFSFYESATDNEGDRTTLNGEDEVTMLGLNYYIIEKRTEGRLVINCIFDNKLFLLEPASYLSSVLKHSNFNLQLSMIL